MDLVKIHTEKFDKAIQHFKNELSALRTGRASSALIENIQIESYGEKMPIGHVASISVPDARTIAIQPWDKSNMAAIEKAIQVSNIGINPVNDGTLIRLSVPPMTEERRKEMVKIIGQMAEQAKIAIRGVREEIVKSIKTAEDNNELTSDDVVTEKEDLQKVVDQYNDQIKEVSAHKEKEVMTI